MPEHRDETADDHDVFYDAPEPESPPRPDGGSGSAADVLVSALMDAGPEAAEHLLKAAQELLLAAKAVVDAGERVVEQTRATAGADGPAEDDGDPGDERRVRRIDLA
ncbi:MAG TPA: hypothetical protein VF152_02085 [Acidimicrobiia bacterium]